MQPTASGIVDGVVKGLGGLMKGVGIQVVKGRGRFTGPNTLQVEGGEEVRFKSAVIATGSRPSEPPIPGIDDAHCLVSSELLEIDHVPERLVVLGGGVIGCEFASIFSHFGSQVTIIEMLPNLIGKRGRRRRRSAPARVQEARHRGRARRPRDAGRAAATTASASCTPTRTTRSTSVGADRILVATGRIANVEDIGLEAAGVTAERRRIPVDASMRTNVPHIFATATSRATGSSPTRPSARARSPPRTRSATTPRSTTARRRAAPTPIPRSPRSA